jgi:DNA mismatch repair protein MutL
VPGPTLWALGGIEASPPAPALVAPLPQSSLPILRVLGQLSGSYILAEGPEGLYLVDQHAAHERILCDRVRAQRRRQKVEVQGLLELVTIEVTARQEELLRGNGEALSGYGFGLELFGARTYLVRTVPAVLRGRDVTQAIAEVLDSLAEGDAASDWEERLVVSLACHGAVRAGDALSLEEMRELVRQLEQTAYPHTCPHGRPTMILLTSGQLEKEFGRR